MRVTKDNRKKPHGTTFELNPPDADQEASRPWAMAEMRDEQYPLNEINFKQMVRTNR
jgi:hypothetical protein